MISSRRFLALDTVLQWRGRSVLLTGATGFVGSHILKQALAAGVHVHTLGRRSPANAVRNHIADITDRDAVSAAVTASQPEAVIHLAAAGVMPGSCDYATMLRVNVGGVESLLSACAALPNKPSIILIGTGFEYAMKDRPLTEDDPITPSASDYGATKAAAATAAEAFSKQLPITLLRPFQIYGPGEASQRIGPYVIARARTGAPIDVTPGEQLRDFLHVDDLARSVWMAASAQREPGFRIYNVGNGEAVTLRYYIEALIEALMVHGVIANVKFGARPYRVGEPLVYVADTSRINASLGWRPLIPLADGAKEMVDWGMAA
jgi:nucleoside-diphosphate-sugar epimerase